MRPVAFVVTIQSDVWLFGVWAGRTWKFAVPGIQFEVVRGRPLVRDCANTETKTAGSEIAAVITRDLDHIHR
jgi:hypothetical protein